MVKYGCLKDVSKNVQTPIINYTMIQMLMLQNQNKAP